VQSRIRIFVTLTVLTILALAIPGFHSRVEAQTTWYWLSNPTSAATPNYYYDLDRNVGALRDWTGWEGSQDTSGHTYDQHRGTDYPVASGSNIYASQAGVVEDVVNYAGNTCDLACNCDTATNLWGTYVLVSHSNHGGDNQTYYTRYAHLTVNSAQVSRNSVLGWNGYIAKSGNTGASCGSHLHWSVESPLSNPVDPFNLDMVCGNYGDPLCSTSPGR